MNKTQSSTPKTNSPPQHRSDGSELVPAEIQVNQHLDELENSDPSEGSTISGSTIDDEGLVNNFAVEPKVYPSKYPSPRQQRRYIYWGIATTLLIVALLLISKFVS
jgi:hypothetical protein